MLAFGVRIIFISLLGICGMVTQLMADNNLASGTTNSATVSLLTTNDAVEQEFQRLMAADDAAQAEADQWIRDNNAAAARGSAVPKADLERRIRERFRPVREAYNDFLMRHPKHARARLAYGSFLSDFHDNEGAREQWEKALALNPQDPAAYNNLAHLYSQTGPVTRAFEYYGRAIELSPQQPLYYRNLGDAIYLYRTQSMEYYHLDEQQIYDKVLELYRKALSLDPTDFPLASDVAQVYYGFKPLRLEAALRSWTNALALARDEIERQGVYLHFARLKLQTNRFEEARAHLSAVTNEMYAELKQRLTRNLEEREQAARGTNAPPAAAARQP